MANAHGHRSPIKQSRYLTTTKLAALLDTGRKNFTVKDTNNEATDEIHKEMAQMRIQLGLVLKHVTGRVEKVIAVNYLTRPPPLVEEYYCEEDVYAMNDWGGASD